MFKLIILLLMALFLGVAAASFTGEQTPGFKLSIEQMKIKVQDASIAFDKKAAADSRLVFRRQTLNVITLALNHSSYKKSVPSKCLCGYLKGGAFLSSLGVINI